MDKEKKDIKKSIKSSVKKLLTKRIDIKDLNKMNIKIFIANILGLIALILFTNLAVAYSQGRFELPFYDRSRGNIVSFDLEPRPRDDNTAARPEPTQDIDNITDVIHQGHLVESPTDEARGGENQEEDAQTLFESFSDEMRRQGFAVSDGVYEIFDEAAANAQINAYKTNVNRILSEGEVDPEIPAPPLLYEYRFVKIEPGYEIPDTRETLIAHNQTSRRTVEPAMDFFLIRSGEFEILCAADGKLISRDFAALNFDITRMRDLQNRTVFKSKNGDSYYVYDPDDGPRGSFSEINFNPVFGLRGAPFMYPSYYGANGANNLNRYQEGPRRLWGYANADTGRQVIRHNYNMAFNFSENIGVAYQDEPGRGNRLFFFNESGQNLLRREDFYYAPDIDEVKTAHLGFFYFDKGLTRAYSRRLDPREFAIVEKEVILQHRVDSRGYAYFTEFYIPEDYTVKAYSNGMILLEKDGFYGFMNYLGEWVYQPIFSYAQPFFEGVAVIGLENRKRALIDTKGNLLTRFRYDVITNCTGGIVALYERSEGWTMLNKVRRTIEIE